VDRRVKLTPAFATSLAARIACPGRCVYPASATDLQYEHFMDYRSSNHRLHRLSLMMAASMPPARPKPWQTTWSSGASLDGELPASAWCSRSSLVSRGTQPDRPCEPV